MKLPDKEKRELLKKEDKFQVIKKSLEKRIYREIVLALKLGLSSITIDLKHKNENIYSELIKEINLTPGYYAKYIFKGYTQLPCLQIEFVERSLSDLFDYCKNSIQSFDFIEIDLVDFFLLESTATLPNNLIEDCIQKLKKSTIKELEIYIRNQKLFIKVERPTDEDKKWNQLRDWCASA